MDRASEAYLGGMALYGCTVGQVPQYLQSWLADLGYYRDGAVQLPKRFCRYTPRSLLEHIYFLKGVFETHGDVVLGEGGTVVLVFRGWSRKLVRALQILGVYPLLTSDESGKEKYTVVYRKRDVKRFFKFVKPVVESPVLAEALGLCRRSL